MQHDKPGICVQWDNPDQSAIRWDFYDWTWDDFHAAAQQVQQLFESAYTGTYIPSILHLKNSGPLPPGAFSHFRSVMGMMETDGWTVVAGASGYAVRLTKIFVRLHPQARSKVFFVDSLAEARALIAMRQYENGSA